MLIKTGELARLAGILPSKVRFYVKEGLLSPTDYTAGGYYLFEEKGALDRLRTISHLQTVERLAIGEIRDKLHD